MIAIPSWVTVYRKALVLSAVAVSAGAAGWTINGWRKGKEMAETQLAHSQADVRRQVAVGEEWAKATRGALDTLKAARQALASQRVANQAMLRRMQEAQPSGAEWTCRQQPLPESYLETFRHE